MNQLGLFAELPRSVGRPQEPIVRQASVSDGCRWWLKRAWGGGPCILWAGANPSDANGERDDPTMWRIMEFSLRWGFGSCIVINPIPHISSTPAAAIAWWKRISWDMVDGGSTEFHHQNYNITECVNMMLQAETHVAAWGNILPDEIIRDWLQHLAEATDCDFDSQDLKPVEWLCLGTNNNGTPRHPLSRGKNRVPSDFKPVKWK